MTVRVVAAGLALLVGLVGCGDGGEATPTSTTVSPTTTASTTTAPELPPSTTTTMFDPATVEGQVEAAYLESWDVYAHAVYHLELDEQAFAQVYAGEHLQTKRSELRRRMRNLEAAWVRVEHDYVITMSGSTTARLVDNYRNHQVLIDSETREPVEPDPNEVVLRLVTLELIDGSWRVTLVQDLE